MDTDEISLEFLFSCLMTNVHVRNFIYNHKIKRSFVKKINFSATLHFKKNRYIYCRSFPVFWNIW